MAEQIHIIIVEPGKKPRRETIEHTLANLQEIVGGTIQGIYPWEDRMIGLLCNEDAIALGLPFNRFVDEGSYGVIYGTFFLCGLGEEDFTSLTEEDAEFLMERFGHTERMVRIPDGRDVILRGI